jgi:hypothetical protein
MKLSLSSRLIPQATDFSEKQQVKLKVSKILNTSSFSIPSAPSSFSMISPRTIGGKFGTSKRGDLWSSTLSPGPGRYNGLGKVASPAYSIKGKNSEKDLKTPGPGAYSPRFIVNKSLAGTIGKAKRNEIFVGLNTPGPGKYDQGNAKFEAPSWSFQGSRDNSFLNCAPGPGRYETVDLNKSSGAAALTSRRQELFFATIGPGPAAYDSHNNSMNGYTIGKSKRPELISDTPGPGSYESHSLSHSFSARFGNERRRTLEQLKDTPGSNVYCPSILDKTPSFTFGLKLSQKIMSHGPGPAGYSPEKKIENVSTKIGTGKRFLQTFNEKDKNNRPGPGSYNITRNLPSGKFFISKSKKSKIPSIPTPGPGSYNS